MSKYKKGDVTFNTFSGSLYIHEVISKYGGFYNLVVKQHDTGIEWKLKKPYKVYDNIAEIEKLDHKLINIIYGVGDNYGKE